MTGVDALHDVDGEGFVSIARAPVGALHLTVASEKVAAHAQWKLKKQTVKLNFDLLIG
jgi:hypothetical protein